MEAWINPKIVGAIIIGFAMVGGAYTLNSFSQTTVYTQQATSINSATTPRATIEVVDSNQDGIEDWRDDFVTESSIKVSEPTTEYTAPETLTGQTGIRVAEKIIQSRTVGTFAMTDEELVENTVDTLTKTASIKLHSISEISIMTEWDDEDIVNYANTVAATIYRNDIEGLGFELDIMHSIINEGDKSRTSELEDLIKVYQGTMDDTLLIPVPEFLAKEHLDLINTYQAVKEDLEAMLLGLDDPIVAFLHLKRYQDDSLALGYALRNMYLGLEPHANLFDVEDPALFFVMFSPDYKPQARLQTQ